MWAHGVLHAAVIAPLQCLVRINKSSKRTMMSEAPCTSDLPGRPLLFHPQRVTCAMDHPEILSLMSFQTVLSCQDMKGIYAFRIVRWL